jgi:hypothetical protein
MDIGQTKIQAGSVSFALQHRYIDGGASHSQGTGGRGGTHADQGVCIQVVGNVNAARCLRRISRSPTRRSTGAAANSNERR